METRASYFLVGLYVIALMAGMLGFVLWLTRAQLTDDNVYYYVYFRGAVTGLQNGSAVRYRGVPVGTVTDIAIDAENVELIQITAAIKRGTPIKTDTVASLQLQGITGLSFIQLTGGTMNAPDLEPRPGKRRAVIASIPSAFERLFESAPDLIMQLASVTTRAAELLSEENQKRVSATLENVAALAANASRLLDDTGRDRLLALLDNGAALAGNLARATEDVEALKTETLATLSAARGAAVSVDALAREATGGIDGLKADVAATLAGVRETVGSFQSVAREASASIDTLKGEAAATLAAARESAVSFDALTREAAALAGPETRARVLLTLDRVNQLADNAAQLLDEDNRREVRALLAEAATTSRNLARASGEFDKLTRDAGDTLASVRDTAGTFQALARDAQGLVGSDTRQRLDFALDRIGRLADDAGKMFDDDNRREIKTLIAEAATLSRNLSRATGEVDRLTREAGAMLEDFRATAQSYDRLARDAGGVITGVGREASQAASVAGRAATEMGAAAQNFSRLARSLETVITDNRGSVDDFARSGLQELTQFLIEARALVAGLSRLQVQFERDPARFLFGDQQRGFEAR